MASNNRILVPMDFSRDAILALRMADFQATIWGASLLILYVETPTLDGLYRVPMRKTVVTDCAGEIRYTAPQRVFYFQGKGQPAERIRRFAEIIGVRAIFMGYGAKDGSPGPVAAEVKKHFNGLVELFSETLAGIIPH